MIVITCRLDDLICYRINKVRRLFIKQGRSPHQCDGDIALLMLNVIGLQQGYRSFSRLSHKSKELGPLFILYKFIFKKLHQYRQFNIYESLYNLEINGDMLVIYLR